MPLYSMAVFLPIFAQMFECKFGDCDRVKKRSENMSMNFISFIQCWETNWTGIRSLNFGKDSIQTYEKVFTPSVIIKK